MGSGYGRMERWGWIMPERVCGGQRAVSSDTPGRTSARRPFLIDDGLQVRVALTADQFSADGTARRQPKQEGRHGMRAQLQQICGGLGRILKKVGRIPEHCLKVRVDIFPTEAAQRQRAQRPQTQVEQRCQHGPPFWCGDRMRFPHSLVQSPSILQGTPRQAGEARFTLKGRLKG